MIFVAKNADFSANKIEKITIPEDVTISAFTKAAMAASGGTFSESQETALELFFRKIGAIENSGVWPKIKFLFLPLLISDVDKALINYVDNSQAEISGVTLASAYECIKGKGIRSILPPDQASSTNDCPIVTAISDLIKGGNGYTVMDFPSQQTSYFSMFWARNIDYLNYGAGGIQYTACPKQYNYKGQGLGHMYGLCANGNTDVLVSFYDTDSYTAVEQTRTAPITFTDIVNFYLFGTNGAAKTQAESGVTERTAHRIYMVGEPFTADEMTLFSGACEDVVAVFAEQ